MKLYDEVIDRWLKLVAPLPKKSFLQLDAYPWEECSSHEMILKSDMAYELGDVPLYGIGSSVITTNEQFLNQDEVIIIGKDLCEISQPCNYARLSLVQVDESSLGEGNDLYNFVKRIDFVRYHLNPKGFMMRISFANNRECARVSKWAIKEKISFAHVGKLMIDQFHKNKKIKAVKVIFITLDDAPYKEIAQLAKTAEGITKTIDHILKNVQMDCHVCSLQKVCEEVEGMKELHFGLQNQTINTKEELSQ